MNLTITSRATLANGVQIPYLGLGVFKADPGGEARMAVRRALEIGYRHVDTAAIYHNEADVGAAIRDSSIPREDIFVTTKLWNRDHGRDRAIRACRDSLGRLGLDYVDLYLVHWPVKGVRRDTWRGMVTLLRDGLCRAIGVSNYTVRHLAELLDDDHEVVPAVNQVEFNPFLYQRELLAFCRERGIQLEAYSPLARGKKLDHPVLRDVAARYAVTPAQVMIRWALQHDLVVIPKSVNPDRLAENAGVFGFSIGADDMARLDALDEGLRLSWDPSDAP